MTDSNGSRSEAAPGDLILAATPERLVKLRAMATPLIERGYNILEVDCLKKLPEAGRLCTHQHAMVVADFHSIVGEQCDPDDPRTYEQSYTGFLLTAYAPLRRMLWLQSITCDLVIVYRRPHTPFVGLGDFVSGKADEDSGYLPTLVRSLERLAAKPRRIDRSGGRWVV